MTTMHYVNQFTYISVMHDMKLTHTDLKPENMLFNFKLRSQPCGGQEADISLIDFGSATFESEVKNCDIIRT